MRDVFGLCATKAFDAIGWVQNYHDGLDEKKQAKFTWQILGPGDVYDGSLIVICIHLQSYLNNQRKLEDSRAMVVIFDTAIVLGNAQIETLDAHSMGGYRWSMRAIEEGTFRSRMVKGLKNKEGVSIEHQVSLLQNLIDQRKGDLSSFIQKITMQSRIPERRRDIQQVFVYWLLVESSDIGKLRARLEALQMEEESIQESIDFFETEVGIDAIKVFKGIQACRARVTKPNKNKGKKAAQKIVRRKQISVPYEKLCKDTQISVFDAKYLMKAYRQTIVSLNVTSKDAQKQNLESRKEEVVADDVAALNKIGDMVGFENSDELDEYYASLMGDENEAEA